ncbi:MAG: YkgJ family cysteine cluster protein [Magnetococcales bacterium]|nr:YkgJ family cysteine cluster protein [Magnetococcales bacterium]
MSDPSDSSFSHADRDQALQFDPVMRDIPREVRNILQPVRMEGESHFQFRCHPGVACFNACCANIEIILTPYDILRLRRRLNITAETFLYEYATPYTLAKGQLPVPLIRLDEDTGKCPFNTPEGCSVYSDRPVACRYYPIGLALMRPDTANTNEEFFYLVKESFCMGHQETTSWTIDSWRKDQGSDGYDARNKGWMEVILKRRSAGDEVRTSMQLSEFFYMASTDTEEFRRFLFQSSFLERFDVPEETIERLRTDDEALLDFAFDWLKTVLFGDKKVAVRPEALKRKAERRAAAASEADADPDADPEST